MSCGPYSVVISKTGFTGENQRRAVHEFLLGLADVEDVMTWVSGFSRRTRTNRVVVLFWSETEDQVWLTKITQTAAVILGPGSVTVAIDQHGHL